MPSATQKSIRKTEPTGIEIIIGARLYAAWRRVLLATRGAACFACSSIWFGPFNSHNLQFAFGTRRGRETQHRKHRQQDTLAVLVEAALETCPATNGPIPTQARATDINMLTHMQRTNEPMRPDKQKWVETSALHLMSSIHFVFISILCNRVQFHSIQFYSLVCSQQRLH